MIQKILTDGHYAFRGNLEDLKKCISSLKVTKVIRMGNYCGYEVCDVMCKFKYHGKIYKLYISKLWTEDLLKIEFRGECNAT